MFPAAPRSPVAFGAKSGADGSDIEPRVRNIFDQYSQNENRLTHALASVLHSDEGLRGNFLKRFLPDQVRPEANRVLVNEQSYPRQPSLSEQDAEQAGVPVIGPSLFIADLFPTADFAMGH